MWWKGNTIEFANLHQLTKAANYAKAIQIVESSFLNETLHAFAYKTSIPYPSDFS